MRKIILFISFLVVLATIHAQPDPPAQTGPVFVLEKTEYDLGAIGPEQNEVVGSVVISNIGDQPLQITRAISSNPSFSGYFGDTTISPSQEGVLFISYFKNKIPKGPSRQWARIYTNDPQKPYTVVYFNFTVQRNAEQESQYQIFKEIDSLRQEVRAMRQELKTALEGNEGLKNQPQPKPTPVPKRRAVDTTVYDIEIGDSPVLGNPKAPVTIVEFSDFQCPYCVREYTKIKTILEEYPKQVRLVFKHYPLAFHKKAKPAQAAAELAQSQLGNEGFWKMHDLVMENPQKMDPQDLMGYAKQIGLDADKLSELLNDPEKIDALFAQDMEQVKKCKVTGTPTILINGLKLTDRSLDGYRQRINEILKK